MGGYCTFVSISLQGKRGRGEETKKQGKEEK